MQYVVRCRLYGNQFKPLRESSGMLSDTFVV
jgi:hypothetical protein